MKTIYLSLIISAFCILLGNKSETSFASIEVGGMEPKLPATPYEYSMTIPIDLRHEFHYNTSNDASDLANLNNDLATLGRVLFYDKSLSVNGKMSCGSCHSQRHSFADSTAFSQGQFFPTRRNSLHLNDITWAGDVDFFWDKRTDPLEEVIILPLSEVNEISASDTIEMIGRLKSTTYYEDLFFKAFASTEINRYKTAKALAEFIKSINTISSRLDRSLIDGKPSLLTGIEVIGKNLFERDCNMCHSGRLSTIWIGGNGLDSVYTDKGAGEIRGERWNGIFKAVHLRNIALTAPYMHDGRFKTIEDVIDFYSEGAKEHPANRFVPPGGFQYDSISKQALVAFLHTLTDSSIIHEVRWADPFERSSASNDFVENAFSIYPNPSNSFVNITCESCGSQTIVEFFDLQGRFLAHMPVQNGKASWQPPESGNYVVKLSSDGQLLGSRVLIVE